MQRLVYNPVYGASNVSFAVAIPETLRVARQNRTKCVMTKDGDIWRDKKLEEWYSCTLITQARARYAHLQTRTRSLAQLMYLRVGTAATGPRAISASLLEISGIMSQTARFAPTPALHGNWSGLVTTDPLLRVRSSQSYCVAGEVSTWHEW